MLKNKTKNFKDVEARVAKKTKMLMKLLILPAKID